MPITGLKMIIVEEVGPESEVSADDHEAIWLRSMMVHEEM